MREEESRGKEQKEERRKEEEKREGDEKERENERREAKRTGEKCEGGEERREKDQPIRIIITSPGGQSQIQSHKGERNQIPSDFKYRNRYARNQQKGLGSKTKNTYNSQQQKIDALKQHRRKQT